MRGSDPDALLLMDIVQRCLSVAPLTRSSREVDELFPATTKTCQASKSYQANLEPGTYFDVSLCCLNVATSEGLRKLKLMRGNNF